jgi:hypothetical protein
MGVTIDAEDTNRIRGPEARLDIGISTALFGDQGLTDFSPKMVKTLHVPDDMGSLSFGGGGIDVNNTGFFHETIA